MPVSEDTTDYRKMYRNLKRKFKFLIYENECFQEELRKAQRKLLKISRDKSFLLDRLLQYESVESSSSDSEATESSDSEAEHKHDPPPPPPPPPVKKKKPTSSSNAEATADAASNSSVNKSNENAAKKKKAPRKPPPSKSNPVPASQPQKPIVSNTSNLQAALSLGDGHMTSEEIERHLEAKQALRDLLPEKAPLTVPMELFSTEPSTMDSDMIEDLHMEPSPVPPGKTIDEEGLVIDLPD